MPEAATGCRELGYTEFLAGRYERAIVWLDRARSLAGEDATERSAIDTVHGAALRDTAHYALAEAMLQGAVSLAEQGAQTRQLAYALSMLGRVYLLRGDLDRAAATLERSMNLARTAWTAIVPWPQALRAEVDLKRGDIPRAAEGFEQAFASGSMPTRACPGGAGPPWPDPRAVPVPRRLQADTLHCSRPKLKQDRCTVGSGLRGCREA